MIIYKYPIHITEKQILSLPHSFGILSLQLQDEKPFIWVLCDPGKPLVDVRFRLYGTGHLMEPFQYYVGTIQQKEFLYGQNLVWHLFVEHIGIDA